MNRPWYEQRLAAALAAVPDLHARLSRPGARVLDVGCGHGWSTIALARAYPDAVLEGVDVDAPSTASARANAAAAGVDGRVTFRAADAAGLAGEHRVRRTTWPSPSSACTTWRSRSRCSRAIRAVLAPDGVLVVMDEAVAEEFTAPGDEVERLMYGFSLFVCLPDGRSSDPSEATGTVMRRSTLEGYARRAGFAGADVLPTGDFGLWRFYALR